MVTTTVKLLGPHHHLHRHIVNNHVAELDIRVLWGNFPGNFQEKSGGEFQDVGLVNGGYFLESVLLRILKCGMQDVFRWPCALPQRWIPHAFRRTPTQRS